MAYTCTLSHFDLLFPRPSLVHCGWLTVRCDLHWDQKTKCITMQLSATFHSEANTVHCSLFTAVRSFVGSFVQAGIQFFIHHPRLWFTFSFHHLSFSKDEMHLSATFCQSTQPQPQSNFSTPFLHPRLWLTAAFHHLSFAKDETYFAATFRQSPRRLCGVTTTWMYCIDG